MQDAAALGQAIASGAVSAPDAMAAAWDRAGAVPGACARLMPRAEAVAAAADFSAGAGRREGAAGAPPFPAPPFPGVPFLAKDLGSFARGLSPAGGCAAIRARLPDPAGDSALFARFRAAGLVPFGLSAVPELGLGLAAPGAVNPFDPALSAGGSSGGAALAVAAGIVAIAHATDAAGSIRVPAACCGLWGLKPSRGAIPQGPDYGNHLMGLASELVLARSLRDVAAAFVAATGAPAAPAAPPRPRPTPASHARIALWRLPGLAAPEARALDAAAKTLSAAGQAIIERPAPTDLFAEADALAALILPVSAAAWLDALAIPDAELSPILRATRARGRARSGAAVFDAARRMAALTDAAAALFVDVDAALAPVLADGPPPALAFPPKEADPAARFARMAALAPGASLANAAGLPALAFPAGFDRLPRGAQLIGPMGADSALLTLAAPLAPLCRPPFPPIAGMPT